MFGIGIAELIFIVVLALMVLGPERLPELARKLGETVRDLRRMYGNLRSELGSDFDEIEQGIRDLRSLDPRQQLRDYGRDLLKDVSNDAPELKQLATAPKLDLKRIGRNVLHDELLDKPLADKTVAQAPAAAPAPAAPAAREDELLQSLLDSDAAASAPAPVARKRPRVYSEPAPAAQPAPAEPVAPAPAASRVRRAARVYSDATPASSNGHHASSSNGHGAQQELSNVAAETRPAGAGVSDHDHTA